MSKYISLTLIIFLQNPQTSVRSQWALTNIQLRKRCADFKICTETNRCICGEFCIVRTEKHTLESEEYVTILNK